MLPKTHAFYGAIFALALYLFIPITLMQAILIFLASFLIDFDHYLWYISNKKDLILKNAYYYLKNLKDKRPGMMLFHTVEFLLLVFLLSFFWDGFLAILVGMVFHSFLDIISLAYENKLHLREFSFIRYLSIKRKHPHYYLD
jgi:hypothetical protein